jgi:acetyl esterase/lipase
MRRDVALAFESLNVAPPENADQDAYIAFVRGLMDGYGGADHEAAARGIDIVSVDAGGCPATYFIPPGAANDERIVYIHGGGWIAGGPKSYKALASVLARVSGRAVLLPDYRLAPEHPFPAPLDDCIAAFEWSLANGPFSRAPGTVCLAGDSAGANLAAALCVSQIGKGRNLPVRLALLCGVLDATPDDYTARHDPLCTPDSVLGTFALYGQGKVSANDPLVSPVRASDDVIARFPPTLIQASADEYLLANNRRMSNRMVEAGSRSVLSIWPLMPHSWHCFTDTLPEARAALKEIAQFFAHD